MNAANRLLDRLLRRLGYARPAPLADRLAGAGEPDAVAGLLFGEAPFGGLVIGADGRVLQANAALQGMTGLDLAPGTEAARVFAPDRREAIWADIDAVLKGRKGKLRDLAAHLAAADAERDGTPIVRVAVDPLRERDGRVTGALLRFTDLTLQTRLEAQLAHSQKLQAVGQLAGGIAHDFNNLLTTVLGAAESIAGRPELDKETRDDAAHIQSGAMRGAALVRQLLAFGRQQRLEPRALAANDVIRDISELLRRLIGERIRLELDLELPGRSVHADPTQLDRVLVNLAVNARDAMLAKEGGEGGVLTLRSGHMTLYRPLARGPETIPPGRYVMIEVADTGTGIPPEVLPRIFDPFFTTKREQGGHGLGLSTVHGIIRQSDGFLAVESEPGQGTRFRIYLPRWDGDEMAIPRPPEAAAAPPPSEPAAPPPAPPPAPADLAILLVEDEEPVRRLAARALVRRGWRVLQADSAEAALGLLDTEPGPVAAIVTDMIMPGMDGAKLVRAVRDRPGLSRLPAILVSGYTAEALRREMESAETVFMPKPYSPKELVARLEQVLAAAGTAPGQVRRDLSPAGSA